VVGDLPASPPPVFFFLHVMKTGGTSLLRHLRANFAPSELEVGDGGTDVFHYASLARRRDLTPERRAQVRAYAGHYPYFAVGLTPADVTVTVLREPVARAVSLLRQVQRQDPPGSQRSLEEIYDTDPARWTSVQDFQVRQFALEPADLAAASEAIEAFYPGGGADALDRPTTVYLEIDGPRLAVAKERLAAVDVVGFQERSDELLDRLAAEYGWRFADRVRLRVAGDVEPAPPTLLRRIEGDNAADVELYRWALAELG
jgi:hypothetical protein